jgi:glucose/mannose transport system permease protein
MFMCAFVPFQIIMYPLIAMTRSIGVYGTIWGVAVVHAVLAMPVLTLIFRNYYKDIPQEIMSAAIMDSGSFWHIFGEIILPMSGNILIVVVILQITSIWNDYLIGVTFGGFNTQPMTVNLANMVTVSTGTAAYNVDMAAALLTAIPPLLIYFLVGKFFVAGITAGAIKG